MPFEGHQMAATDFAAQITTDVSGYVDRCYPVSDTD